MQNEIQPNRFEPLFSDKKIAPLLGVSVQTLRNWRSQGVGPVYIRIGTAVRYRLSVIENFIQNGTIVPQDKKERRNDVK